MQPGGIFVWLNQKYSWTVKADNLIKHHFLSVWKFFVVYPNQDTPSVS